MSSPVARRGAWAPDPITDAPTGAIRTFSSRTRGAFPVQPGATQHATGVHVEPSRNALTDYTRQDAKALGIADVSNVSGSNAASGTVVDATVTPGCMPLPQR